jgi:hypothetical protein
LLDLGTTEGATVADNFEKKRQGYTKSDTMGYVCHFLCR